MGGGKSVIGKMLSRKINFNFYDLDQVIESKTHMKIPQIFATRGEPYFRKLESKYLKSLSRKKKTVISLGGGTLLDKQNLKYVRSTGILVYLKLDFNRLLKRIRKTNRPLVKKQSKKRIKDLFQQRAVHYKKADLTMNTNEKTKGEIVRNLVGQILESKGQS